MEKALKVIASCKTLEQWESAANYVTLFGRSHGYDFESYLETKVVLHFLELKLEELKS